MAKKILRIGKSDENNIVIKHAKISRKHCEIRQEADNEFVIEDKGSSNGTYLNSRRIRQSLISITDGLRLADFELDITMIFYLFEKTEMPQGLSYDELLKKHVEREEQERIYDDFLKLEDVYNNYIADKKKMIRRETGKRSGIGAGLALIPVVGIALSQLSRTVGPGMQEKMLELDETFKTQYTCPKCSRFLGNQPFVNLQKIGKCAYCKAKWVRGGDK